MCVISVLCAWFLFCLRGFCFVCVVSFFFCLRFLFSLRRFFFICVVSVLFACFLFCLGVSFLFAACPLWAIVDTGSLQQHFPNLAS